MVRPLVVERQLTRVVELAHQHVGLDVTFLSRFCGGQQIFRAVAGDPKPFGIVPGAGRPLAGTPCARMACGELPHLVQGPGTYLGVPVCLPDGRLYGTLASLSSHRQPRIDERDIALLRLLADHVAADVANDAVPDSVRDAIVDVLDSGRLTVALQPVVSLQTGELRAVEALARFPTPLGRPDAAFSAAAEMGLRHDLEMLAVERALEVQHLVEAPLAVNLSPDCAIDLVEQLPGRTRLDGLVLELTEHVQVDSYADVRDQLQPLRDRGLRLAVDDTGAGFASLRHVVELQPDIIKIDRSLVAGIDRDQARRTVVTTFVLLALDTGAKVIAEGVETPAELATVAELGVDQAQGYLLARPSTSRVDWARWTEPGACLLDPPALAHA
ncbi:MAG: EAL domain-containing protein [Actinomycetes bacterium]